MITNRYKERSDDRILVLQTIDGKKTLNGMGLVDTRLFTGDNRLHLIRNPRTRLWFFKYDDGAVPLTLKQKFTSFEEALKLAVRYFTKRNIEIKEVID